MISLIAIPLSLIAAMLVLDLRGATINMMVLAGLVVAVGVVVDDAIIDVENIVRRLRQHRARAATEARRSRVDPRSLDRGPQRDHLRDADHVVAVVPVLLPRGPVRARSSGRLSSSYGLAVLASMVVALTVTPALCLMLLSQAPLISAASRRCCACSSAATRRSSRASSARPRPAIARGRA